jgi:hypothetical protein
MASINATTSSGIVATADNTGQLQLQSAGTTVATISSTGLTMNSGNIVQASGAAPTFRASKNSGQAISTSTWTKIQYNVEDWDTNSNYDNVTNYRFTPTVAGYYQVDLAIEFNNISGNYMIAVYKNGSDYIVSSFYAGSTIGSTPSVHGLIYMNGSTDYLEGYAYTTTSPQALYNGDATYFNASMVRSA